MSNKAITQETFLNNVRDIIKTCANVKDVTPLRAAELTAFSILVMLDGEAIQCGPFAVRPIDEAGKEGEDIAGFLHGNLNK